MSTFSNRRRLLPTQVDFSKVVSGSVAGVASFVALDGSGKLVLGNPADYFNVSVASTFAGSGLTSAAGVINVGEGTGISVTADAIATNDSEIVHDNLSGFVANEHIDHSGVTITAGSGLTGGGDITTTRTLTVGQGTGITVASTTVSTNDSEIVHDNLSGFVANEHIDHSSVSITAGTGLSGGGTIASTRTLSTNDSEIVHDNLSGFVANEHIDHSGVTITAGDGLTGGGTIASTRTLAVGQGTGISVSSDAIATNDSEIVHDNLSGFVANEHIDHSGVTITAGDGLTGGGTIASTRTLAVGQGTGISVSSDAIATNDSEIVHDNLSGFVANEHIDHSGVTITAGDGLTGGGTIASTRTLAVGQGTGISVSSDAIATNDSEIVHDNLSGFVANEHIDHSGVTITAGDGLTGGGTIASTRTLTVGEGTGITVASTTVSTNDSEIVHDNLSGFVANEHINHTSVSITAGNGLTGGGTIASTRTLAVGQGTGVTVNANDIAIGQAVGTSDDVTFSTVTVASDIIHSGDTDNKISFGTDTQTFTTANATAMSIDSSGRITKPLQPCFRATKSSAQENIAVNTRVVITFDGESFDRGSNFASNAFTAPVAGIYLFGGHADFDNLDISASQILMSLEIDPNDGGSNYYADLDQKDPNEYNTDMERFSTIGSTLIALEASDVVKLTVYQAGGAAISDLGTRSKFWGTLIN